jgi:hypothetical protein
MNLLSGQLRKLAVPVLSMAIVWAACAASAQVTLVQHSTTGTTLGSATSRNQVFGSSNVTAGDLLVLFFAVRSSTTIVSASDNQGDTFTLDGLFTAPNIGSGLVTVQYGVFSCGNAAGGATTATLASSISTPLFTEGMEFSGVSSPFVWTLNAISAAFGTTTAPSGGSITTTIANVALIGLDIDTGTPTPPTGFAGAAFDDDSALTTELYVVGGTASSTGTYNAVFSDTSSVPWGAMVAAYGGALPPTTLPSHMVVM